jgi:hypothetical protein
MGILLGLTILCINFKYSELNKDLNLNLKVNSLFQQTIAFAEQGGGEACVTVKYYSQNMEPCVIGADCYDDAGNKCGFQRCCQYTSFTSDCNELDCINF